LVRSVEKENLFLFFFLAANYKQSLKLVRSVEKENLFLFFFLAANYKENFPDLIG